MSRLRRAFHQVEKRQAAITRVEREITQLQEGFLLPARIIEVTVSPQGETTIQTKGYAGADCLQASKFLEQSLGVAAADTTPPSSTRRRRPAADPAEAGYSNGSLRPAGEPFRFRPGTSHSFH